MNKEELKALGLTDEQIRTITENQGKAFVSKGRFNEVNEENKALKTQMQELNKRIETLVEESKDNAHTVEQLEMLKAEMTQAQQAHEKDLLRLRTDHRIEPVA